MRRENKISVSLVLGSGGARGLAHIGAIHWLEENGYEIRSISGCSMGALIGGIYACGEIDVYEKWARDISKADVVRLLNRPWGLQGPLRDKHISTFFEELIGDRLIEDLAIKFTAVAVDIRREKEVWFRHGSLLEAIRASISSPFFFRPLDNNGIQLVDGGMLNPVPIAPTLSDNNDLTIAIDLTAKSTDMHETMSGPESPAMIDRDSENKSDFGDRLMNLFPLPVAGISGPLEVAAAALDAMQGEIARQRLAADPLDHTIMIARNVCGALDFDRADEMISLGYMSAAECLGTAE